MIRTASTLIALSAVAIAQQQQQVRPPQQIVNPMRNLAQRSAEVPVAPVVPVVAPASSPASDSPNAIDLVICLDTSGSMNGLINAARQNLWAVVNDLATLKPQPELRVALLTYGSPAYGQNTGFVSVQTGLTDDLDLVSEKLFALTTSGGSEYVARVVRRALDDLEWAPNPKALKLMFVAGNEAATQDPEFNAMEQSRAAINAGVLVNTIYCGNVQHQHASDWQKVATLADGKFASIDKDQAVVITTPFDKQITELSASLNATYVRYGADGERWLANQVAQDSNALNMNTACAAQRGQSKGGALYYNPRFDLVDACKDPKFELAKIDKKTLPETLQKLTPKELEAHVAKMRTKREGIQKQIVDLGKKRDAYVVAERKKLLKKGDQAWEEAVLESVRAQARSRGFDRKPEPVVEPPVKAEEAPQKEAPAEEIIRDGVGAVHGG